LLRPLEALDPTGEKARAVKARYVGACRGCGACTQPRNGKGDTDV
jgi:Fe-S cluster biogenesis protein NfuA